MLEHARTSTGQREPTDLNGLADEYLKIAYHGFRRSGPQGKDAATVEFTCKLVTNFSPDLPQVEIMPQEIGRVLLNLFTNAFYTVQQCQKTAQADYVPTVWVSTLIYPPPP